LFRVWIAATTISDITTRYEDIHHHYSDSGMFPREFILRSFTNHYWITLHMISGAEFIMRLLFIIELIIAFLMLVGYRTRTMTILSWVLVCSVQNRNYVLGHSGDTVHRLFLFVGIFLPLARVFSVDRALECVRTNRDCDDIDRDREREKRRLGLGGNSTNNSSKFEVTNFCTALFCFQLLAMYFMAHHHKTGAEWREKGIAAWMALQLDYFRTWFGDILLLWTPGVIFGNYAVLAWQYYGSLMFFSPFFTKYFQALTFLGFFAMHIGFGMAFYLETFTWATLAAVSGIIPTWVWDLGIRLISKLPPFSKSMQIHVMANCKACLIIARILDECMLPGKTKIIVSHPSTWVPASDSKSGWDGTHFFGISLIDQNKNVVCGPAVFSTIARSSPILYPVSFILKTRPIVRVLTFLSNTFHSHSLQFSNDSNSLEAGVLSDSLNDTNNNNNNNAINNNNYNNSSSKLSFRPHYESFEKFEKENNKKDDDDVSTPSQDFVGLMVEPVATDSGVKEFEVRNTKFTRADVSEASKVGAKAAKEAFVAFLLILVISNNAGNLDSRYGVPPPLQPVLWVFQLDQYWGMFAPRPPDVTWWYNFEGYLDDGTHVELFNDGALHSFEPNTPHTFNKPNVHESIGNHRWFKLFENGLNSHSQREEIRLYFGRWFCREYNARHFGSKKLHKYSIHFMYERLNFEKMDGSRYPPAKETIWNHICYEKAA